MIKRQNFRIYPTKAQQHYFQRVFGTCRWVYNWALAERIKHYDEQKKLAEITGEKPKGISAQYDLGRQLPILKKAEDTQWLSEAPSGSLIHTLLHVDLAYKNYFNRLKKGIKPYGFPSFKSKHHSTKSFSFHAGYRIEQRGMRHSLLVVPKAGPVRMKDHRPIPGTTKTVTISQTREGKYYASIVIDDGKQPMEKLTLNKDKMVGLDHGVINTLTLSDGHQIQMQMHDAWKLERREKKYQQDLSRKVKGSANFEKARLKKAKVSAKIASLRKHGIENAVMDLACYLLDQGYCGVVLRKYDVKRMVKKLKAIEDQESGAYLPNGRMVQRRINRKILSGGLGALRVQLVNKLTECGFHVVELPAEEDVTTHKCSRCGNDDKKLMFVSLKSRTFECGVCEHTDDMDINAAQSTLSNYLTNSRLADVVV